MSAIPHKVRAQFIAPVQGLIEEGQLKQFIAAALIEWQKRGDAKPGLLPYLVADVIKEQNAGACAAVRDARTTWDMSALKEYGYHWSPPDLPDDLNSANRIREYMNQRKREWLDGVSADIEQKWQKKITSSVCAANPGVEESEVVKLLCNQMSTA